jgi:hypothetical protein
MSETVKSLNGHTQDEEEGDVIPYVPGSSDPAAEDPWDQPDAPHVEFRLTTRNRTN